MNFRYETVLSGLKVILAMLKMFNVSVLVMSIQPFGRGGDVNALVSFSMNRTLSEALEFLQAACFAS